VMLGGRAQLPGWVSLVEMIFFGVSEGVLIILFFLIEGHAHQALHQGRNMLGSAPPAYPSLARLGKSGPPLTHDEANWPLRFDCVSCKLTFEAMMDDLTFEEFATFIREYRSIPLRKQIRPETQFERDLGLTGDDGNELIETTERRFGVRLCSEETGVRETFNLGPNEYLFHSEGIGLEGIAPSLLFGNAQTVRELTVGELFEVVRKARSR
jgi:hypothetical protein